MEEKKCCICFDVIKEEEPSILTMGNYANPKYLCRNCAKLIETATTDREYSNIAKALDNLSKKLNERNIDDEITVEAMTDIMENSAKRANRIKDGTYDFSEDEKEEQEEEDSFDEIPEELKETEEDKILDEIEEKEKKKWDKITTVAFCIICACAIAYLLWRFFAK